MNTLLPATLTLALLAASGAAAETTRYESASALASATSVTHQVDFEGLPINTHLTSLDLGGVRFEPLSGTPYGGYAANDLTLVDATNPYISPPPGSRALSSNGDEDIRIRLQNGATFTAIGFDVITNSDPRAPTIYLFGVGGGLIESFTLSQGPNRLGYFGVTSTAEIAYVDYISFGGAIQNTALDNVAVGVSTAPEPHAWALLLVGFGAAGGALRSSRRRARA